MRHFAKLSATALILILVTSPLLAANNPVPGVGVIVKKHPPNDTKGRFGTVGLPAIPADFFGPGSEPFVGTFGLQGPCDLPCGQCNCSELRIDYSMDTAAGPFETEMVPMTLHSVAPITVGNTSGIDSFFDIAYRITFTEAGTTVPAGQPILGSLRLELQEPNLPITCLDDGSPTGVFVLGLSDLGIQACTYGSSGGALYVMMESVYEDVVGVEDAAWGTVKGLFR